ncbi:hypothetical protein ACHAQA_001287 [Verticillium albo-atrum]
MPRPTRSRRAPARAAAAAAKPTPAPAPAPAPASDKSSEDIYSHSDREHEHLRSAKTTVGANEKKALQRASRDRNLAMQRLAGEDMSTSSGHAIGASDEAQVELGRKEHATPAQQRRDTTGLELDDEMFGALDDSLALEESEIPGSVTASGHRSANTSSLFGMGHKRRGRTPSISLQGNDVPIRPPSRGVGATPVISSSFNIGAFKRRAREPSILGTAQKARAPRPSDDSSEVDQDEGAVQDEDDEEAFAPEAESTPLNRRKVQQSIEVEHEQEPEITSSAKSRKRKSTEGHNASDRPDKASRLDDAAEADAPEVAEDQTVEADAADSDAESDLSSLSSMASPALPVLPRPVTPFDEEIMAPPMSSGSEDESGWPDIHDLAKRRRHQAPATPARAGNVSDVSSPPSLTHSPNFPATRQKRSQKHGKKQKASSKVTTADLAGLLPRRRQRKDQDANSDSEVDNSGLGQDDDELSYLDARAARRRARTTPLNRSTTNRPASRGDRAAAPSTDRAASSAARTRRTYGRRASDKENTDDGEEEGSFSPAPDDTFDATPEDDDPTRTDELKNAVTKFKEVDKWELEYEEMTQSSSPSGAR